MPVYAHCPSCGLDFESRAFAFEGATNINLQGNWETCPSCGQMASIMDGRFNISGGTLEVLDGPQWTRDLLIRLSKKDIHKLRTAVAWVEQQPEPSDHTADVLAKSITVAVPQVAPWLRRAAEQFRDNPAGWTSVLIALVTLFVSIGANQGISADQLEEILDETVRSVQNEQVQPSGEEPMQPSPATPPPEEPPTATELPTPKTR